LKPGWAIREQEEEPLFFAFSPHAELRETRIEGRLVAEVVKRLFRDAELPRRHALDYCRPRRCGGFRVSG
jgi:hypothetical protein